MNVIDRVYGKQTINESVLIDLIESPSVQRLKNIDQFGVPEKWYIRKCPSFSRYEHSLGASFLIKKLGGSLEEQAAGIIHDVSHTAFSHVIDWVLDSSTKENFQDTIHDVFVEKSEIPEILKSHKMDPKKISDYKNFTLLETEIPNLCADRVDYTLRELKMWANPSIVDECMNGLVNVDGYMVFRSKDIAHKFAIGYMKCQKDHWNSVEGASRYHIFGQLLKTAMEKGIIRFNDFFTDDVAVLKKIERSRSSRIQNLINILEDDVINVKGRIEKTTIRKKFRYIDPEYIEGDKLLRLSETDKSYKSLIEEFRLSNQRGIELG